MPPAWTLELTLSLLLSACSLGCSEDKIRRLAPAPGPPSYPVTVAESENLKSIETDHLSHKGEKTRVKCETCHARVDVGSAARAPKDLSEFHLGLTFSHGSLACASCHEPGSPLLLHLATGEKLEMRDAMLLCSQCHGPQRRSYENGSHGGMNGHWDLSRGPRLKNQCVHCHDPHTPQIPQVLPVLAPRDRGTLPEPGTVRKGHP